MVEPTIPQIRCDFYVYVIFRPNGVPCYVGKGQRHRWRQHARASHNKHLAKIYAKAGGDLPIVKLREGLTSEAACEVEIAFIRAIGRGKSGPLTNMTDGGEGLLGRPQSREHYVRVAARLKGVPRPEHVVDAMRRAKANVSPETRLKLSAAQTGKKASPETRAKQSAVKKGKPLSPEHIENARLARIGFLVSEETKAKISAAWTDERKAAFAEQNLGNVYGIGNKRTPDGQARVTASVALANARRIPTDEYREKRRQIALSMHAKRRAGKALQSDERDGGRRTG